MTVPHGKMATGPRAPVSALPCRIPLPSSPLSLLLSPSPLLSLPLASFSSSSSDARSSARSLAPPLEIFYRREGRKWNKTKERGKKGKKSEPRLCQPVVDGDVSVEVTAVGSLARRRSALPIQTTNSVLNVNRDRFLGTLEILGTSKVRRCLVINLLLGSVI